MIKPVALMLLMREGVRDWDSLCRVIGNDPRPHGSLSGILIETLLRLSSVGLVDLNGTEKLWESADGLTFKVSDKWLQIQSTLELSLRDLARLSSGSLIVEPFFGRGSDGELADVFVMMPFRQELQPVYEDHLSTVAKRLNLKVRRADDFFGAHAIMEDIWNAILTSKICVADCSGRNANVFYEIGIAHTVGRPVVLIAQNADDIPFDLHHVRYILYGLTPRGMRRFEEMLQATLVEELGLDNGAIPVYRPNPPHWIQFKQK